ncbi:MAG: NAD(P)H-dependent oxidoreductase [Betaproteobacteria bacterium]|nr:NAD(P)H-dependent oxidoreductase [Betaproteobacteria bacterium]
MILVLHAHPYPSRSRAGRALLAAATDVANIRIHSLYDRYPDFDIAVTNEQAQLREATRVVMLHPVYWYAAPGLLKHWMDKVLVRGFAYGPGGDALVGKSFLWAPTTGGDEHAYSEAGMHERAFSQFMAPMEQTARYCRMQWEPPFVVHGAHLIDDATLAARAAEFAARLAAPVNHAG